MSLESKYKREVARALKESLDQIRAKMTVIFEKYSVDGKLSLANMTQYNRLNSLEKDILQTMSKAARKTAGTIDKLLANQYGEAYFHSAWAIDQTSGVALKWGALNKRLIVESLSNRMYKISLKEYGRGARGRILRALNSGLAQGKSYADMARELKHAINTTQFNAERIMRTEGQTAVNAAQNHAYVEAQEQGVDMSEVWDSTLDDVTRETHQAMDGQTRAADGLFDGPGGERAPYPAWEGLSAGERISCRCRLRAEIEGYAPSLRRTRESGIVPYQTYPEWKQSHSTWK